jgi:hypothetical protein
MISLCELNSRRVNYCFSKTESKSRAMGCQRDSTDGGSVCYTLWFVRLARCSLCEPATTKCFMYEFAVTPAVTQIRRRGCRDLRHFARHDRRRARA